jgi:hypothetical protein
MSAKQQASAEPEDEKCSSMALKLQLLLTVAHELH